ncbi:hypothetical protein BKA62DRAFT_734264 [Auriculariales sp. MPI-PUGE-AT-0066]|nr:hypothetical protein BKA62DRAFT_734264 [Auriculariales sp. MPI-PUGE-AT-0066]
MDACCHPEDKSCNEGDRECFITSPILVEDETESSSKSYRSIQTQNNILAIQTRYDNNRQTYINEVDWSRNPSLSGFRSRETDCLMLLDECVDLGQRQSFQYRTAYDCSPQPDECGSPHPGPCDSRFYVLHHEDDKEYGLWYLGYHAVSLLGRCWTASKAHHACYKGPNELMPADAMGLGPAFHNLCSRTEASRIRREKGRIYVLKVTPGATDTTPSTSASGLDSFAGTSPFTAASYVMSRASAAANTHTES